MKIAAAFFVNMFTMNTTTYAVGEIIKDAMDNMADTVEQLMRIIKSFGKGE